MTDVTPEMLNPPSPKKQNITRKVQDEENVANHSRNRVEKKEESKLEGKGDIKLEVTEDVKLEVKEDIKLETKEGIKLETKEGIKLEMKEGIKLEMKEDIKLGVEEDIKEHLKLKERVAALGVKSDGNFVQWQKSFGKHEAPSVKKGKNREGETKEERRERKEKRRAERKEAERRVANRWEKEKQQVVGKPPLSLMMQELDNSNSWSVKEGERKKVKEEDSDDEYADLPEPVYACKPDCRCSFHF